MTHTFVWAIHLSQIHDSYCIIRKASYTLTQTAQIIESSHMKVWAKGYFHREVVT